MSKTVDLAEKAFAKTTNRNLKVAYATLLLK